MSRERAPQNAHLIERLLADAEIIAAQETAASSWDRTDGRAEAAWNRVAHVAYETVRDVRLADQNDHARWESLAAGLDDDIEKARAELHEGAGLGRRESTALERAEFHADYARREAASGRFGKAAAAADIVRQSTAIVHDGSESLHSRFGDRALLRQWHEWVDETVAESKRSSEAAIVIDKLNRRLDIYHDGLKMASFSAELGANGLRPKLHAGDRATPEGRYRVREVRANGDTKFYKALLLNYPNADDVARFRALRAKGQIPLRVGIGSLIEIHGSGGQGQDWTDGCIALRDRDMDKLFQHVRVGMPVTIVGTYE